MISCLPLRVTSDTGGNLKIRTQIRPDLQEVGDCNSQQASAGIYWHSLATASVPFWLFCARYRTLNPYFPLI